jgi:hypothetical protein
MAPGRLSCFLYAIAFSGGASALAVEVACMLQRAVGPPRSGGAGRRQRPRWIACAYAGNGSAPACATLAALGGMRSRGAPLAFTLAGRHGRPCPAGWRGATAFVGISLAVGAAFCWRWRRCRAAARPLAALRLEAGAALGSAVAGLAGVPDRRVGTVLGGRARPAGSPRSSPPAV